MLTAFETSLGGVLRGTLWRAARTGGSPGCCLNVSTQRPRCWRHCVNRNDWHRRRSYVVVFYAIRWELCPTAPVFVLYGRAEVFTATLSPFLTLSWSRDETDMVFQTNYNGSGWYGADWCCVEEATSSGGDFTSGCLLISGLRWGFPFQDNHSAQMLQSPT